MKKAPEHGIQKVDLVRIGARLVFYQTTWCEGGMQSIGLTYCLLPGLRSLARSDEHLSELVEVAKDPFNTHPFLGGAVAGVVLNMVERNKSNAEIQSFLHGSMGPLAALGDPFLRGALPIFVAAVSSLMAMYLGVIAGVLTLLCLFNSVHLFIRVGGFMMGYRDGIGVLGRLGRILSHSHTSLLKHIAAVGVGSVLVKAALLFGPNDPLWIPLVFATSGLIAAFGLMKWKPQRAYFVPIVLILILLAEVLI